MSLLRYFLTDKIARWCLTGLRHTTHRHECSESNSTNIIFPQVVHKNWRNKSNESIGYLQLTPLWSASCSKKNLWVRLITHPCTLLLRNQVGNLLNHDQNKFKSLQWGNIPGNDCRHQSPQVLFLQIGSESKHPIPWVERVDEQGVDMFVNPPLW